MKLLTVPPRAISNGPSRSNLQRLFVLRNVMILFLLAVTVAMVHLHIPLPDVPIAIAVCGLLVMNVITFVRLKQKRQVSEQELLWQLLADLSALTALFYFTGGYSNPLVWMYLLPLTVAAVALKRHYALMLAFLVVVCYTTLVFYYVPLSHLHMHYINGKGLDIHLVGMWLGFVVSAGIISMIVTRIGQNLRDYDQWIANVRENALENERMLALGTLATAAAHELGTPLATLDVVSNELLHDHQDQPELAESLQILRSQVKRCKSILTSMTAKVGQMRAEEATGIALDVYMDQLLSRWQDTHPRTVLQRHNEASAWNPRLLVERTLDQAIMNLLDNAADASPEVIEVAVKLHGESPDAMLKITVRDFGAGIPQDSLDKLGTPFYSTKEGKGLGIGLYLSMMIIQRMGGILTLSNHRESGAVCHVELPISHLLFEASHATR